MYCGNTREQSAPIERLISQVSRQNTLLSISGKKFTFDTNQVVNNNKKCRISSFVSLDAY